MFPNILIRERSPGGRFPASLPQKFIAGLIYGNNAVDSVNDLDFVVGKARSDDDAEDLILPAALTKQSDVNFQAGTGMGALDSGAVGNSDYYIWLIGRSGARPPTDILYSLSSTAPAMPVGFVKKRLIGWFKRAGGTIVAFHTYETEGGGIEMNWDSPTLDINLANTLTTARRTDAVKVPQNFSTTAHLNVILYDAASNFSAWLYCPDQTDLAPSATVAPLSNAGSTTGKDVEAQYFIRTSATGTIAARANLATVDTYLASTIGFRWARRN